MHADRCLRPSAARSCVRSAMRCVPSVTLWDPSSPLRWAKSWRRVLVRCKSSSTSVTWPRASPGASTVRTIAPAPAASAPAGQASLPLAPPPADEAPKPAPSDVLINPISSSEEFLTVVATWLKLEAKCQVSRIRLNESFAKQKFYDTERLIGSASMFDLLPDDALPSENVLDQEFSHLLADTKAKFRDFPLSPERDSILNSLGRVSKPNLKQKILHRAKIITSRCPQKLTHFDKVLTAAVDCRNFYVHGGESKIDYSLHTWLPSFFTDALIFTYIASEFVEAGWDFSKWSKHNGTLTHPMSRFWFNYDHSASQFLKIPGNPAVR